MICTCVSIYIYICVCVFVSAHVHTEINVDHPGSDPLPGSEATRSLTTPTTQWSLAPVVQVRRPPATMGPLRRPWDIMGPTSHINKADL